MRTSVSETLPFTLTRLKTWPQHARDESRKLGTDQLKLCQGFLYLPFFEISLSPFDVVYGTEVGEKVLQVQSGFFLGARMRVTHAVASNDNIFSKPSAGPFALDLGGPYAHSLWATAKATQS